MLSNPIYVGEIRHKNLCHPGQHKAILDRAVWDRTQQQLREHRVRSKSRDASVEKSPLTGRLVDENGNGLTPSHARKGERKYRYYVSRNLPAQGSAPSRVGWRLPARELEDRVAAAIREMLDDQASVLEAAQKTDIDSRQIDRVLHAARTWSHRLQSEAEQTAALAALVERVELKCDGMGVSIKLPIADTEKSRAQLSDAVAITRSFPMQLKRRGVELRLIVGDHNRSAATVDLPLLKAVARAHRWFDEISTGKAGTLAEIAAREGLAVRYVGRVIRLAFLAPDIVESIVEGRQPTQSYCGSTHPAHRDPARMALAEDRSEHSVARASAPNSSPTERKSKLRGMTRHVRLSPVPVGRAHRPYTRAFCGHPRRMPQT